VARLLETGINPAMIFNRLYGGKDFNNIRFLGEVLLKAKSKGRIAWIEVDQRILLKYNVSPRDSLYFVNNLLIVENIDIVCVFRQEGDKIKIGFRSNKIDVGKVAEIFGGGGHKHIAAALVDGQMKQVIKKTIDTLIGPGSSKAF
jgi:phosphoesterase RecJ-like protein